MFDYVKMYKKPEACPPSDKRSLCTVVHDENDAESNEGAFSRSSFPRLSLQPSS